jgi:hypothetical protein
VERICEAERQAQPLDAQLEPLEGGAVGACGAGRGGHCSSQSVATRGLLAGLVVVRDAPREVCDPYRELVAERPARARDAHAILEDLRVGELLVRERIVHREPVLERRPRARDPVGQLLHAGRLDGRAAHGFAELCELAASLLEVSAHGTVACHPLADEVVEAAAQRLVGDLAEQHHAPSARPARETAARDAEPVARDVDVDVGGDAVLRGDGHRRFGDPLEALVLEQLVEAAPARIVGEPEVLAHGRLIARITPLASSAIAPESSSSITASRKRLALDKSPSRRSFSTASLWCSTACFTTCFRWSGSQGLVMYA